MTEAEKGKHTQEINKKINNMRLRKDTPQQLQDQYVEEWKQLKNSITRDIFQTADPKVTFPFAK
jgi:hypothetical protein